MGRLRRIGLGVLVTSLGLSGLSYAGTGAPNPVRAVLSALSGESSDPEASPSPPPSVSPSPTETPEATESPEPTETPEPSETPEARGVQRSHEGCPEGFEGNHGRFVSEAEDHHQAAHSTCGMRLPAVEHRRGPAEADEDGHRGRGGDDHRGRGRGDEHRRDGDHHGGEHGDGDHHGGEHGDDGHHDG